MPPLLPEDACAARVTVGLGNSPKRLLHARAACSWALQAPEKEQKPPTVHRRHVTFIRTMRGLAPWSLTEHSVACVLSLPVLQETGQM